RKRREAELEEEIKIKRKEKEVQEDQERKEKELLETQQREKEIEEEKKRKLREQEELDRKLKEEEEVRKLKERELKDLEKQRQLDFIERERKENELLLSQAKEVQFPDVSDVDVQTVPSNKEDIMVQTVSIGSEHTMVQTTPLNLKQTQTSFTSQEKEEILHEPVQTESADKRSDKSHKEVEKKSKKSPKKSKDKAVSPLEEIRTETPRTSIDANKVITEVQKQVPVITEIVDDNVTVTVDTAIKESPEKIVEKNLIAEKEPKTKKSLQRLDRVEETYTLEKVTQVPSVDDKSIEVSQKLPITLDTSHNNETVPPKNEANGVTVASPKTSKVKEISDSKNVVPSKKKSSKKQKSDQSVSSESGDSKGKQKPHLLEKVSKYFSKSSKKKSKETPSSSFDDEKSQDISIKSIDSDESKVLDLEEIVKSDPSNSDQVKPLEISLEVDIKDSEKPQTPSTTEESRTDSTPSVENLQKEKPGLLTIKQTQTSFSSQEQEEVNKQKQYHKETTTKPTRTSETLSDVSDDSSKGKPQGSVESKLSVSSDKQTKRSKKTTDKKDDVSTPTVLESKSAAKIEPDTSDVSTADDLSNTQELKINITAQIDSHRQPDTEESEELQDSEVDRPEVQKTSGKITKKIFGVFKKHKDVPSEKSPKQKESSPTPVEKGSESSPSKEPDGKKDFHDVLQKGKKLSKALLKKAVDPRLHESSERSYSVTSPSTSDDGGVQIEEIVTTDAPESSVSAVSFQTIPEQDTLQHVSTQVVSYPEKDFETTIQSVGSTYRILEGATKSTITKSVIQQTSTSSSDFDDKSKPIIELEPGETTFQILDDGTTRSVLTKSVIQQTSTSSSDFDDKSKPIIELGPGETTFQILGDGTTRSVLRKSVIQQTSTSSSDFDDKSKPIIELGPGEATYQIALGSTTKSVIKKSVVQSTSTITSDLGKSKPITEISPIDLSDPSYTTVESVTSTQVHDPDVSSVNLQSTFVTKSGIWVSKSSSTVTSRKVTKTVLRSSKTVDISQDDFNQSFEDMSVRTSNVTRV
ncbi:hypothetical protein WDU94_014175, partial [Cyamophila willieti]